MHLSSIPLQPIGSSLYALPAQEQLQPIIERIQQLSEERLQIAYIAIPTLKQALKQPYGLLKILPASIYATLLGLGALTSYSSFVLLANSNFSSAFSSNLSERVYFANNITNSGALFACITDFPAITYVFFHFVLDKPYRESMHEVLDEIYHTCVNEEMTPEMHEELYQRHISLLQSLRVEKFYRNPDPLSSTGAAYRELASVLTNIDSELEKGVSFRELAKNGLEALKQDTVGWKLAKMAAVSVSLFTTAFSCFIIMENSILVQDTPVSDLFSADKEEQTEEAFYLTQLGGLFSSLTAIGAVTYMSYRLFVQSAYKKAMQAKIEACFAKYSPGTLSSEMRIALYRIKEIKLKSL